MYLSQVRSAAERASVASAGFFREKVPAAGRLSPHPSHHIRRACGRPEQGAHESLTCPELAAEAPLAGLAFVTIDGVWSATHSC